MYENRAMKPVATVLRRGWKEMKERRMEGERVNLRYVVSTYVNVTTFFPVQLSHAKTKQNKTQHCLWHKGPLMLLLLPFWHFLTSSPLH
jgi:hypothetical protein